jgi:hypothetical protein
VADRSKSARRRQEARDLMSRAGRSSAVERQLSDRWGLSRRQTRRLMTQALQEMAKDRPQRPENFALLEAVAWENLAKAAAAQNHRAINAYLRTLAHIEANSRPEKEVLPAAVDPLSTARKAAARTNLSQRLTEAAEEAAARAADTPSRSLSDA